MINSICWSLRRDKINSHGFVFHFRIASLSRVSSFSHSRRVVVEKMFFSRLFLSKTFLMILCFVQEGVVVVMVNASERCPHSSSNETKSN